MIENCKSLELSGNLKQVKLLNTEKNTHRSQPLIPDVFGASWRAATTGPFVKLLRYSLIPRSLLDQDSRTNKNLKLSRCKATLHGSISI
jgi:hypothetical protein